MRRIRRLVMPAALAMGLGGCVLPWPGGQSGAEGSVDGAYGGAVISPDAQTVRPHPRGLGALFRPRARPGQGAAAPGLADAARGDAGGVTAAAGAPAAAGAAAGEERLGVTIASLGDPGRKGFWLETPLVAEERQGRVVWADNGNSVAVTLIPSGGAPGSGSRISLEAMQALGIPLTALPRIVVIGR